MKVIELDHATLVVGDRRILVDTSFAIEQGEFIGLLGPNGAGRRASAGRRSREILIAIRRASSRNWLN
jgi:ABC-type lipopolysaccharide export system ATPase subunit